MSNIKKKQYLYIKTKQKKNIRNHENNTVYLNFVKPNKIKCRDGKFIVRKKAQLFKSVAWKKMLLRLNCRLPCRICLAN